MSRQVTDPGTIARRTYSADAFSQRKAESGLFWTPLGALNSATKVEENSSILIYNDDTVVHFAKFGTVDVVAPTDPTDGVPIPPGQLFILSSGPNKYVISDSANVYGYQGSTL